MDQDFYKALTDASIEGEKRGVLMTKLAIIKWLLDADNNNNFKSLSEISLDIFSLQIGQFDAFYNRKEKGEYEATKTSL